MSCWCDGDDPGCEVCHPGMHPDARHAFRRVRDAQKALEAAAVELGTAMMNAERFDAFGRLKETT
jgi:hypothetical protein